MTNSKLLSFAMVGMVTLQIALSACDKPKQREDTIDQSIADKLVEVSALRDFTSDTTKAYFYKQIDESEDSSSSEVSLAEQTPLVKADESIFLVLDMVKNPDTKAALDAHMSSTNGLIGFAIFVDQVKIYKVLTKAKANEDDKTQSAKTLLDIKRLKKASLEAGQQKVMAAQIDMSESNTDVMYIEIASIKIAKSGVLENKRTKYYDEKTSILIVGERSLDVSTHLLLEPEKTTEESSTP